MSGRRGDGGGAIADGCQAKYHCLRWYRNIFSMKPLGNLRQTSGQYPAVFVATE